MLELAIPGWHGFSVKWSPFFDNRLAVATAANYGLAGNGRLFVMQVTPKGIEILRHYPTNDALYDVAHAENHSAIILTACGDGSIRAYDTTIESDLPVAIFHEHTREVYTVAYNLMSKAHFATSSWDGTVKVWDPSRQESLHTLETGSCTYSVAWAPNTDGVLSAVCSDSHLRVWDLRIPKTVRSNQVKLVPLHADSQAVGPVRAHSFPPSECLTHDWNKYRSGIIATGSVDTKIRTFDLRSANKGPLSVMYGHKYAVRKVTWSPHKDNFLASGGYDMSARVWVDTPPPPREVARMDAHTEFVTGLDWCMFGNEGWIASTAWDETVRIWDVRDGMHPPQP